jgi:hypothetical protein
VGIGFLKIFNRISQIFTTEFNTMESKNPMTIIREERPGLTGCLYHNKKIANRKHILQIKAARLSILKKAISSKI